MRDLEEHPMYWFIFAASFVLMPGVALWLWITGDR